MLNLIECPICESQFELGELPENDVLRCPDCDRKFVFSADLIVKAKPKRPQRSSLASQASLQLTEEEKQAAVRNESNPKDDAASASPASVNTNKQRPNTILRNAQRKQKRFRVAVIGSLAFLVISGVLIVLLVQQLNKESDQTSQKENAPNPVALSGDAEDTTSPVKIDPSPLEQRDPATSADQEDINFDPEIVLSEDPQAPNRVEPPRKSLDEFDPPKLKYFRRAQLAETWKKMVPYVVDLKIHDAKGVHPATGTIINSKGWIVTSYEAIRDANKIEVIQCANSYDELGGDLLVDEVRGIIPSASSPELNLAVLEINRRFVLSFADIQFAKSMEIVNSTYLMQCGAPSEQNPFGASETQVKFRGWTRELPEPGLVNARKLDNPELEWIITESEVRPTPGTPIVNAQGQLAAIAAFNTGNRTHAVLPLKLTELIENSDGESKPLTTLGGGTPDTESVAINQFHPALQDIQKLNQLGEACKGFNWVATSKEDYSKLQEFGEQIFKLETYADENPDEDESLVKPVRQTIKQWNNEILQRFSALGPSDSVDISLLNKFAEKQVDQPNRVVAFYGDVYLTGVDLVDRMVFRFKDDQAYVNVPFNPDGEPMFPGKKFLFFVKTVDKQPQNLKGPDGIITTNMATQLFSAGPLN